MSNSVALSLAAGLSIYGIDAAVADQNVNVWRWYVSSALRAQPLKEGRASAIETDGRFIQRYERYFDGAPMAAADLAHR